MIEKDVLDKTYKELLEEKIINQLAEAKGIPIRQAMDIYYRSKLSQQINDGRYGIENMDYRYLVQDLIENEPELFDQRREGNGYARITYYGIDTTKVTYDYNYLPNDILDEYINTNLESITANSATYSGFTIKNINNIQDENGINFEINASNCTNNCPTYAGIC